MERFEDSLETLESIDNLEKEYDTAKTRSKAKKAIIIGAAVALACAGILTFNASNEEEVALYGPAPVMEETQEQDTDNDINISEIIKDFDPGNEEVICDYGIPSTSWRK